MRVNRASLKILPRFEASMKLWWRILFQWNWGRRDWRRVFYWAPAWFKVCGSVMKEAVWYHALWCQRWPMLGSLEAAGSPPQRSNYSRAWRKGGEEKKNLIRRAQEDILIWAKWKSASAEGPWKLQSAWRRFAAHTRYSKRKKDDARTHQRDHAGKMSFCGFFFF